jgi:hypothetical protein
MRYEERKETWTEMRDKADRMLSAMRRDLGISEGLSSTEASVELRPIRQEQDKLNNIYPVIIKPLTHFRKDKDNGHEPTFYGYKHAEL